MNFVVNTFSMLLLPFLLYLHCDSKKKNYLGDLLRNKGLQSETELLNITYYYTFTFLSNMNYT